MKALKKHPRLLYALLLCVFLCFQANANTLPHCKELISKGIDAMSKKDYVKSLELLTEARALAEKNNWHEQLFLANNNIGNTYYSMLDYGEAINYYLEAYNIALKELEPVNEMVVLNNIAILYSKENNQTRAREYFKKAYDIAKQNNDRVKIGMYALNLGNLSNEINQPNEARKYILEALPYLKGQTYLLLQAETTLAENELLLGFPKKAREKAQNILLNGGDTTYNDTAISLLLIIARSYLAENNFPEAISYANKVLAKNVNLETKFSAFRLLSDIYAKSNRLETALAYKDSLLATQQKLNEIKNGRQFENNRVKFEIQNYKNEIAVKEEKLEAERKL
ncbi:MAG TPA: tetratricopeptide repeat protein, partial [Flavobacterium sp.]|nr:tetratricopeptide repeat protein [Flavobacterium sp.]